MTQHTGDKYKEKGASLESGVSECEALDSGSLRPEGQGQRPSKKEEAVKSDRGSFKFKH